MKQESSAIAEDEAYIEFHTLVFNIKREAQMHKNISGTCSDSIMNKGVTEFEEIFETMLILKLKEERWVTFHLKQRGNIET